MKRHSRSAGVRWAVPAAGALAGLFLALVPASPAGAADAAGTLRGWGRNTDGQVGDGTFIGRTTPTPVVGLSGMRAVAAGGNHSLAAGTDGTVRAWGDNSAGQLGDGTTTDRPRAITVTGLPRITTVSAGDRHSLAVAADGSVWAWGQNDRGQLGDGTTVNRTRPVPVQGLPGLAATSRVLVSAGADHSVVGLRDGSLWAWGFNGQGQLGDGTRTNRLRPVLVHLSGTALAVSAGLDHTVASRSDLTVATWGDNSEGQLGDGTTTDRLLPAPVAGLTGVIQISAGGLHTLVRLSGEPRTALAWGANGFGQLGDGTTTRRTRPVRVLGLVNPNSVRAGAFHSLAQELDGDTPVRAWGNNSDGQLGDGTITNRRLPVVVRGVASDLVDLAAGGAHSLSLVVIS